MHTAARSKYRVKKKREVLLSFGYRENKTEVKSMEVFTAIYDGQLAEVLSPCAMILDEHSFHDQLIKNKILFFGSGSMKWKTICSDPNASFEPVAIKPEAMSRLSFKQFSLSKFYDPAYSEPFYLKEFQTVTNR